jgi:hypothetical protein
MKLFFEYYKNIFYFKKNIDTVVFIANFFL